MGGTQPHEILLSQFDQIDWHSAMDKAQQIPMVEDRDNEESEAESETCEMHQRVCPKCMRRSTKYVMLHVVSRIKGMCMQSDSIKTQKMCHFAREHKDVAFGMLLAKVEPWKFAFGYCVHRKGDSFWGFVKKVKEQIQEFVAV